MIALGSVLVMTSGCREEQEGPSKKASAQAADEEDGRDSSGTGVQPAERTEREPLPKPGEAGEPACWSRKQVSQSSRFELARKIESKLSVVRVAPDDVLHLRKQAHPESEEIEALAHDEGNLRPTGAVCFVGDRPWFQVETGKNTGWASGKYLAIATELTPAGERYVESPELDAKTPWDLARHIEQRLEAPHADAAEGKVDVEIVGFEAKKGSARAVLYSCCQLDDSVQGSQAFLELAFVDGHWTVAGARERILCRRGVSEDGKLCL